MGKSMGMIMIMIMIKYGHHQISKKDEKQRVKIAKIKRGIKLMLYCKKNNLAPIFTRPKFAIRVSNYLRNKTSHQILETEIRNQHIEKEINSAAEREH